MNLIPAIDILNGKCVRLKQGDYDQQTIFSDDPVEFAVKWSDAGADWIVTGNLCEEFADAHELQTTLDTFITTMQS